MKHRIESDQICRSQPNVIVPHPFLSWFIRYLRTWPFSSFLSLFCSQRPSRLFSVNECSCPNIFRLVSFRMDFGLEYCAGTIIGTLTLPAKLQTRPTLPAMFSNPPDPPRDVFKPARPAPQCFQTRPTRPVYPKTYPNPTRLPAESMMQIILVATAYDSISGQFSNEINFQLFFEDVFFELERHIKYMKVQMDEMTNANNYLKKSCNKVRAVEKKGKRNEHSMDQSSSLTVMREWLIKYINQTFSVALNMFFQLDRRCYALSNNPISSTF